MSTATDYRTRELAKRDRQTERRTGRNSKQAAITAFTSGLQQTSATKLRGKPSDATNRRAVGRAGNNTGGSL